MKSSWDSGAREVQIELQFHPASEIDGQPLPQWSGQGGGFLRSKEHTRT